jgi:hypothetical protein
MSKLFAKSSLGKNTKQRAKTLAYLQIASALKKNGSTILGAYISRVPYNICIQSEAIFLVVCDPSVKEQ